MILEAQLSCSSHSLRWPQEEWIQPCPYIQCSMEKAGSRTNLLKHESWSCVTLSQLLNFPESSVFEGLLGEKKELMQMAWPSTWHTVFYK